MILIARTVCKLYVCPQLLVQKELPKTYTILAPDWDSEQIRLDRLI